MRPAATKGRNLLSWFPGCAMVYPALLGVGRFVLGAHLHGLALMLLSGAFVLAFGTNLRRGFGVDTA